MKLRTLVLKNIRSYPELLLTFQDGTTLLEGDIGSGKSTILLAIEFALFGLGDQKPTALLRIGTQEGIVRLQFEVEGKEYEIERKLEKKKKNGEIQHGSCYIIDDSGKHMMAITELKHKILSILDFNEPRNPKAHNLIYRYAIFTPQEEMKSIISEDSELRLDILRKLFRLEDYKTAGKNTELLMKELEFEKKQRSKIIIEIEQVEKEKQQELSKIANINDFLKRFSTKKKFFEENIRDIEKSLKKNVDEIKELDLIKSKKEIIDNSIEMNLKLITKYQKEFQEYGQKQKETEDKIKNTILELKDLPDEIPPTTKSLSDLSNDLAEIRHSQKKYDKIETEIRQNTDIISQLQKKCEEREVFDQEQINSKLAHLNQDLNRLENTEKELDEKLSLLEGNIGSNDQMLLQLSDEINQIHVLGNKCPTCFQEITDQTKEHLEQQRQINMQDSKDKKKKYVTQKHQLEEQRVKIRAELTNLQKELQILTTLKQDISNINQLKEQNKNYQNEIHRLKEASNLSIRYPHWNIHQDPVLYLENLKESLNKHIAEQKQRQLLQRNKENQEDINRQIEFNKKRKEIEIQECKMKNVENQKLSDEYAQKLFPFEDLQKKGRDLQKVMDEMTKNFHELDLEIAKKETERNAGEENLSRIERQIEKSTKELNRTEQAMDYFNWLDGFFLPTLPKIEMILLTQINQEFNDEFQRWFSILVPDAMKSARIDENFTPIIEQEGYELNVNYLSGGEKTSVALAYRLALNNAIKRVNMSLKSNLLIFDEPTDGFSDDQLFKFRDILGELNCPQVLLVSHEKQLEGFADYIYHVEKHNNISVIKQEQ